MKKICNNCDSILYGLYCSSCGQREHEKLSFSEIKKDFFDDIFDYDARLLSSLKYLLLKPGFLTLEYWKGKRVKHLQPFKIYLITSVLYYLVTSFFETTKKNILDISSLFSEQVYSESIYYIEDILISYSQEIELILFTPITGLVLMILYKKTDHAFLHHMIASVHLSSFIFITLSFIEILANIFSDFSQYIYFFNIIIPCYAILMLSELYEESRLRSTLKVFLIFITVVIRNIILYALGFLYLFITK